MARSVKGFPWWGSKVNNGYVKSIQQVTLTLSTGQTSNTATINSVNLNNVLILTPTNNNAATTSHPSEQHFYVQPTNSTTLTITRAASGNDAITAVVTVIEFISSAVKNATQYGVVSLSTAQASNTATINAVSANAFVVWLGDTVSTNTTTSANSRSSTTLTNTTTVTGTRGASGTNAMGIGFLVFDPDPSIITSVQQRTVTTSASGTTATDTISSVNVNNTILIFGGVHTTASSPIASLVRYATLTNSTTVTLTCNTSDTLAKTYRYTALEFAPGVLASSVQRGAISIGTGTSATATLSPTVDTLLSAVNPTNYTGGVTGFASNNYYVKLLLTNNSTITASVLNSNASGSMVQGWELAEFALATSAIYTGSATLTEDNDTANGSGIENITGSAAITESADAAAASGLEKITGSATLTESNDTVTASGTETITGSAALTEDGDSVTASGSHITVITASAAITESDDTAAGTGLSGIRGSAALTESNDTVTASGKENYIGTAALTESNDTVTAAGVENFTATAALTESNDTASGTGSAGHRASSAITETGDTAAGTGIQTFTATAGVTETGDTAAGTGLAGIRGSAALTEAVDAVSGAGKENYIGSAALTESNDTVTGVGKEIYTASAALTETGDTAQGSGTEGWNGTAAITETRDTANASGLQRIIGSAAITETRDSVTASGQESILVPTLNLNLFSDIDFFVMELIKFSGDPVPAEHMEDALKLDADGYVDLFQIALPNALASIYLKLNKTVDWQGNTYEGTGIQIEGVANYADDTVSRPKLTVFNPQGVYSYLLDKGLLDSATIIRYRVLKQHIDENKPIYRRQQWKVSRIISVKSSFIAMELRDMLDGQNFLTPGRMFIPPDFPTVSLT